MPDIFGRQDQVLNGGLSSDAMFVTWPSLIAVAGTSVGLLIQQIGLEYRQPVRRIFEIGPGVIPSNIADATTNQDATLYGCDGPSPRAECAFRAQPTYYIIGRPEGRLQMGRIVGPNALSVCFYQLYGNPCCPNVMTISGKAGCTVGDPSARLMTWTLNGVLLDSVGMNITAQEMIIQEQLSAMFVGLDLVIAGDTTVCGSCSPPVSPPPVPPVSPPPVPPVG